MSRILHLRVKVRYLCFAPLFVNYTISWKKFTGDAQLGMCVGSSHNNARPAYLKIAQDSHDSTFSVATCCFTRSKRLFLVVVLVFVLLACIKLTKIQSKLESYTSYMHFLYLFNGVATLTNLMRSGEQSSGSDAERETLSTSNNTAWYGLEKKDIVYLINYLPW